MQYRIAEEDDEDAPMPAAAYRRSRSGASQGSPADLRRIQQARQALHRYPRGAKRGADAVRVSWAGWPC